MKKNFLLFCLSMISIFAFAQYDVSYYHTGELKAKPGETIPLTINQKIFRYRKNLPLAYINLPQRRLEKIFIKHV